MLAVTVSRFVPTLIWDWRGRFDARAFPDYGYFALFTDLFARRPLAPLRGRSQGPPRRHPLRGRHPRLGALVHPAARALRFSECSTWSRRSWRWRWRSGWRARRSAGTCCPSTSSRRSSSSTRAGGGSTPTPIQTIPTRGAFDPAVVEKVKTLGGNYILFENTASLSPYPTVEKDFEHVSEEWDVHAPGFLRLATGKRFFSHPGYNPHPYYDMRRSYIATGTFDGKDLDGVPARVFQGPLPQVGRRVPRPLEQGRQPLLRRRSRLREDARRRALHDLSPPRRRPSRRRRLRPARATCRTPATSPPP